MRKIFSCFLCVMVCFNISFAQNKNEKEIFYDGPYVLYRNENCIVYTINSSADPIVSTKRYPISMKAQNPVQVSFPANPSWDFSVSFHASLSIEPSEYRAPEKLFAISDIEGEFTNFRTILIANKIMDEQSNWIFGKGHMVICGDLFDRGDDVVPELWLIYKLEAEAKKAGGYVHTILGDHEIMNLSGDLRYLHEKYAATQKYLGMEYTNFYDAQTELGQWLRTKNIIEKIGDNLCMHAGLSREVIAQQLSLEKMNALCRPYYDKSQDKELLDKKNVRLYFDGRSKSQTSPFWYRGYFSKGDIASEAQVDSSLELYGCKRILVGHTIVPHIEALYGDKVIALDVNEHKQSPEAVLIENGKCYKVDVHGKKTLL